MHTKARDYIDFGWVIAIRLLVVVNSLELILFLLIQVAHLGKDLTIRGYLCDQDVVPLDSLSPHTDQLVHMSYLVDDLIAVWDDCMQLFKGLKRLVVVS